MYDNVLHFPMGRGATLTDEERGRIRGLHESGWRDCDIAHHVNRSHTTIQRVIKPAKKTKEKQQGRTPTLSEREVRVVVRAAAEGMLSSAQIKDKTGVAVSARTVRRILARVDWLVYCKVQQTLPLSPRHIEARLTWAKSMLKDRMDWTRVAFSDEKRFCLDGPDGWCYYYRDIRQPPRTTVRRQNGGGGIMIWGAFSSKGRSQLAILRGKQDSDAYIQTMREYMLPFARTFHGDDYVYQQDGATIHRSRKSMQFFADESVNVLPWPSRSPDLNPIENLWAALSRVVYANGKQYASVSVLSDAVVAAWTGIDTSLCGKLVDSMTERCIEVIERNGKKTHY